MKVRWGNPEGLITAMGALLALALFAFVILNVGLILRSPDLLWHVKTGEMILADGHVPRVDTFSHTYEGHPWIAKEWLGQVIMALAYFAAGWAGTLILTGLAVALTGWILYAGGAFHLQPLYAALLVIAGLFFSLGSIVARPYILTFPIAAGLTLVLFRAARQQEPPPFWSLLLMVLWTNLHGSFAIGLLIAGCAWLDYGERTRLADRKVLLRWIIYLVLAVLCTVITPYFIEPFEIALTMAGGISSMSYIAEWSAFAAPDYPVMELGLMLVLLLLFKTRPQFTFGQILFALLALHMMLLHIRFLYVFFLLVPLALLPDVAAAFPASSKKVWAARPRDGLENAIQRHARILCGLVVVVFLGSSLYLALAGKIRPPETSAISGALAYVEAHRATEPALQKKVYNAYEYGGALILAGIKTYIDGRSEQIFLGDFLTQYIASEGKSGSAALEKILSQPDIGWAIIPVHDARETNLQALPGWKQVYADAVAAVWEKSAP